MMQKSSTFTTTFRLKKCYFHYDYACKKVPLSLRYAKNEFIIIWEHVHVWLPTKIVFIGLNKCGQVTLVTR
jgi:hypothetical protein